MEWGCQPAMDSSWLDVQGQRDCALSKLLRILCDISGKIILFSTSCFLYVCLFSLYSQVKLNVFEFRGSRIVQLFFSKPRIRTCGRQREGNAVHFYREHPRNSSEVAPNFAIAHLMRTGYRWVLRNFLRVPVIPTPITRLFKVVLTARACACNLPISFKSFSLVSLVDAARTVSHSDLSWRPFSSTPTSLTCQLPSPESMHMLTI